MAHILLVEDDRTIRMALEYALTGGALPMPPRVHGLDTVVLESLPVKQVTLLSKKSSLRLTMDFPDFDYARV